MPGVRPRQPRGDADGRVPVLLHVQGLRDDVASGSGRLLCLLLVQRSGLSAEADCLAQVLAALEVADFFFAHIVEDVVLVVETEVACGKPPFDRPADHRASAPTVRIAATGEVVRIVDPLNQRSAHVVRLMA